MWTARITSAGEMLKVICLGRDVLCFFSVWYESVMNDAWCTITLRYDARLVGHCSCPSFMQVNCVFVPMKEG